VITGVAVRTPQGEVHALPWGARHHTIIHKLSAEGEWSSDCVQGFVNEKGQFLNRVEAGRAALESAQIMYLRWPPKLYSEDLW